jgi:lysophospholipase L1-like esterase
MPLLPLYRFRRSLPRVASERRQSGAGRRIASIVFSAVAIFLVVECALQIESEIVIGESVFDVFGSQSRYVRDKATGLKLLRPNHVVVGSRLTTRTNSLGLRSPEIPRARSPGSFRIAVVGASTVMGVGAATNEDTFPALLESRLRKMFPGRTIEVINAGIAGYTLEDERLLLERLILPLRPDLVIAYTGVNDFRDYCDESVEPGKIVAAQRHGLPLIALPGWLRSVKLTLENTAFLRVAPSRVGDKRDPHSVDLGPYRARLEALARTALSAKIAVVLATNARAYRPEQPPEQQQRLSFMAHQYFLPCFDIAGLHALHDLHNAEILKLGKRMGFPVLPLAERIPGGERYFDDSFHLSNEGERLVAEEIFQFLMANHLVRF